MGAPMIRFQAKRAFREIRGSDGSDGVAWFWACGSSDVEYGGETIPLGAQWKELSRSAVEYLSVFAPPMIEYHDQSSRPIGIVERCRILTRSEAASLGIPQSHDEALYLGVRLNATGLAADNAGELIYSSIGFVLNWTDEDGVLWPMAIKELSNVPVPHLKRGQTPRPALRSIQLADNGGQMEGEEMPEEGAVIEEMMTAIKALNAQVAELAAQVASLSPTPVEAEDMPATEEEEEAEAEMADTPTVRELKAQVAAMQARLADADAERAIAGVESDRVVPANGRGTLKALYLRDANSFAAVVGMLPKRPAATPRVAGVGMSIEGKTLGDRAQEIANAKGIAFSDAIKIAQSEGFAPGGN